MNPLGKPTVPTTIDELLEYPRAAEAMTDDELHAFLRPYFPATRPAKQTAAVADKTSRLESMLDETKLLEAARKAKAARLEKEKTNEP